MNAHTRSHAHGTHLISTYGGDPKYKFNFKKFKKKIPLSFVLSICSKPNLQSLICGQMFHNRIVRLQFSVHNRVKMGLVGCRRNLRNITPPTRWCLVHFNWQKPKSRNRTDRTYTRVRLWKKFYMLVI